jgi:hypothetical protein
MNVPYSGDDPLLNKILRVTNNVQDVISGYAIMYGAFDKKILQEKSGFA